MRLVEPARIPIHLLLRYQVFPLPRNRLPMAAKRARPDRKPAPATAEEASGRTRIIGGELRGRWLEFEPSGRTRPMKDRVRETLFDLLGTDVRGTIALDLFAGTGALAFEALSRGAATAVLAERHFPTADALRRSARGLGLEQRVEVRPGDVLLWARRMPPLPTTAAWTAFVSPPWSFFADRWDELRGLIAAVMAATPPGSTVVVESDTSFDAASLPEAAAWTSRQVPPAVLHFWRRAAAAPA
jgi:16S rRNA (guanine966-N2)-methyltransferase